MQLQKQAPYPAPPPWQPYQGFMHLYPEIVGKVVSWTVQIVADSRRRQSVDRLVPFPVLELIQKQLPDLQKCRLLAEDCKETMVVKVPWWWSSSQRPCHLLWLSEFEPCRQHKFMYEEKKVSRRGLAHLEKILRWYSTWPWRQGPLGVITSALESQDYYGNNLPDFLGFWFRSNDWPKISLEAACRKAEPVSVNLSRIATHQVLSSSSSLESENKKLALQNYFLC